ncbi:acyl carrier protein [Cytobacillus praedii]|uniref:acyl carrier protein n=1 Tax=Cytobacillus praedii TaxID=1742358 RepID=UPI003F7DED55
MEGSLELYNRTIQIISELTEVSIEEISDNTALLDLGFDSLMALELSVYLEREFEIRLTEDELVNMKTLKDIMKFCEGKKRY